MKCPKCGNETDISSGVKFCTFCGARLVQDERDVRFGSNAPVTESNPIEKEPEETVTKVTAPKKAVQKETGLKYTRPESKNTDNRIMIGIGAVVVLLIILIVLILFKKPSGTTTIVTNNGQNNPETALTQKESEKGGADSNLSGQSDQTAVAEGIEEAATEDVAADTAAEEAETESSVDEYAIHRYDFIVEDITWTDALNECIKRGGHLARINSSEEFYTLIDQIERLHLANVKFWIGGSRESAYEYRWVFNDSTTGSYPLVYGDERLDRDPQYLGFWLENEPSYYDDDVDSLETKMNMIYIKSKEKWVWNDVPDDVLAIAPFYSGSIGYICEYDD